VKHDNSANDQKKKATGIVCIFFVYHYCFLLRMIRGYSFLFVNSNFLETVVCFAIRTLSALGDLIVLVNTPYSVL
jgi:hypothetical protein